MLAVQIEEMIFHLACIVLHLAISAHFPLVRLLLQEIDKQRTIMSFIPDKIKFRQIPDKKFLMTVYFFLTFSY